MKSILTLIERLNKLAHFILCNKTMAGKPLADLILRHFWKIDRTLKMIIPERGIIHLTLESDSNPQRRTSQGQMDNLRVWRRYLSDTLSWVQYIFNRLVHMYCFVILFSNWMMVFYVKVDCHRTFARLFTFVWPRPTATEGLQWTNFARMDDIEWGSRGYSVMAMYREWWWAWGWWWDGCVRGWNRWWLDLSRHWQSESGFGDEVQLFFSFNLFGLHSVQMSQTHPCWWISSGRSEGVCVWMTEVCTVRIEEPLEFQTSSPAMNPNLVSESYTSDRVRVSDDVRSTWALACSSSSSPSHLPHPLMGPLLFPHSKPVILSPHHPWPFPSMRHVSALSLISFASPSSLPTILSGFHSPRPHSLIAARRAESV